MKRIVCLFLALMAVFSCFGLTSIAMTDNEYKQYEPTEFTYTYGGNTSGGYKLAWKNPLASTLQRVTVYSIGEDNASQVVESPMPGAISVVTVFSGNTSRTGNYDEFRLVFEFSDGETREIYYTGYGIKDNALTNGISSAAGLSFGNKWSENSGRTRVNVNIQNNEAVGNNAMQVISNRTDSPDANYQTNEYAIFFDKSDIYQQLQNGVSYKISMKVKSEKNVSFGIRTKGNNNDIKTISVTGNSNWQDIEETFTSNANAYLSLGFGTLASCIYIDNIEVKRVSDDAIMVSQNFETITSTISAPTSISAVSGDKSVTFNWTTVNNDTRFYNVYEKLSDGTYILRAKTKHTDTGVTLSNLEEGKVYDFTVTGSALIGLESAKGENRFKIKVVNPQELYEPKEFTYTYGGNNTGGYILAWKNPSSSTLESVTVYSIDEDNTSQVVASPTPGEISMVTVFSGNTSRTSNYDEFRLVFEFSDGETREVYYTGREIKDNALTNGISSAAGLSFGNKWSANSANTRVNVYIQNNEAEDNNALQVISNRSGSQTNEYAIFFDKSDIYQQLQSGVSYKISMKVKSEKDISFGVRTKGNNDDIKTISVTGDYDWQDIEETFSSNANAYLSLGFGTLASCVYIDNVEVTRVSDDAVMVSQNFETVTETYSAPTGITATAGNGSVTFQWTPSASADSRYVNVYEQLANGTLLLRAKVKYSDTGVTLTGLENGKEYSFVVSGGSKVGLETAKSAVYAVTPTMPDFEILSPVLKKGGAEVDTLTDGTHSVSVDVRNNKLGGGFSAKLIVAVYDVGVDTEGLESFYFSPINDLAIDTEYTTYNVNGISLSDLSSKNCVLRVMVWNNFQDINALCNMTEFGE